MKKLTNEILDERLKERNIKRIDNFINTQIKIHFQCLIHNCQYLWMALPSSILSGKGCPKCGGHLKLNNDAVDDRLKERNIKRIDNYINKDTTIYFQCLICECIWKCRPNDPWRGHGCPKCAGLLKINIEMIDELLKDRSIKRIGQITNSKTKTEFQCLEPRCNYIWLATPSNILHNQTGCPKCARSSLKLTNEIVDNRLLSKNIRRIDNYCGANNKINFQCMNDICNFIWSVQPSHILNNNVGCPNCFIYKNEKLVGKILKDNQINYEPQKLIKNIVFSENNRMCVDFYLSKINTIIEYNGEQHYRPICFGGIEFARAELNFIKQQKRDQCLQQICDDNNIKLIWIDGRQYKNSKLKQYLLDKIIPDIILKIGIV